MLAQNDTKLEEIFRIVLELDDESSVQSVRKIAEVKWDSLAHTSLVAAIESEFDTQIDMAEMDRMSSYSATRLMLEEKGL